MIEKQIKESVIQKEKSMEQMNESHDKRPLTNFPCQMDGMEDTIVSEVSQAQEAKDRMFSLKCEISTQYIYSDIMKHRSL
jgi:hypothetical protein